MTNTIPQYPLVTIVLPIFRPQTVFLLEAIQSVVQQDYPNLELVISNDDKIIDDTILQYINNVKQLIEIRYVCNDFGQGIFSNLNYAIQQSKGDFIQLFSQDDIMTKPFISHQIEKINSHCSVAMIFSSFEVIDKSGKNISKKINYTFNEEYDRVISQEESTKLFLKYGCLPGNISPVLIRKSVIDEVGPFNQELPYAGDFDYWVRISEKYEFMFNHYKEIIIRKHEAQASFQIPNKQLLSDLTKVYSVLIDRLGNVESKYWRRHINKKVGSSFVHHNLSLLLTGRQSIGEALKLIGELRKYPFHMVMSVIYYLMSIPSRVIWKLT